MAMISSQSLVNFSAISFIFVLLFANQGRRTNGCEDDGVWSQTDLSFSPCDNSNLDQLYQCGLGCRQQKMGVGACIVGTCMCCAMDDADDSFLSRGYQLPCMGSYAEDHVNCDKSCYKQGANFGECDNQGWCRCHGNPAGIRTMGCEDHDRVWSETELSFSPCENTDLDQLYECGSDCRQQNLGVGACFSDACMCCPMENPIASFKSRGYSVPCKENVDSHQLKCDDSCYKQGANNGECFEGSCHCNGIPAK